MSDTSTENLVGIKFNDSPMALLSKARCATHTLQFAVHDVLKVTAKDEIAEG